jgi:MscS family membrane protein
VHVIGFGDWSIKVEVYVYVDATELPKFLSIQEDLATAIIDLVRKSGADFAFPSQTTYLAQDPAEKSSVRVQRVRVSERLTSS